MNGNQKQAVKRSQFHPRLISEKNLSERLANSIDGLIVKGIIRFDELSMDIFNILKDFPVDNIDKAMDDFVDTDFSSVPNKTTYLYTILQKYKELKETKKVAEDVRPLDSSATNKEVKKIDFKVDVLPGQRHYMPSDDWQGEPPKHGLEVFMGKLPRDMMEDEIVTFLEKVGPLYSVRLMMDPSSGENKGFCFAVFMTKQDCQKAAESLDGTFIRDKRSVTLNISRPSKRLFIGSIPKSKSRDDLFNEFSMYVENLSDVIIYADAVNLKNYNRGFCFLDFETHLDAANAKRKISHPNFYIFVNTQVHVEWADPVDEPDDDVMNTVKVLFIKNLTVDVTEEMVQEKFAPFGEIEKVKRMKDYAFVHYNNRDDAIKALDSLDGCTDLGSSSISVTLAKPVSDEAKKRKNERKDKQPRQHSFQQRGWDDQYGGYYDDYGYGGAGNQYGYGEEEMEVYYEPVLVPRRIGMRGRPFAGSRGGRGRGRASPLMSSFGGRGGIGSRRGTPRPLMARGGRGGQGPAPAPIAAAGIGARGPGHSAWSAGVKRNAALPIGTAAKQPRQEDWGTTPIAQQPLYNYY